MPPPTAKYAVGPMTVAVRIAMFQSSERSHETYPRAPVYTPRRCGSRHSMISIARGFGAPVIEPPGNVARIRSGILTSGRRRPRTTLSRWCTFGRDRSARSKGMRTLPKSQTFPRSLRSRSTIITFSAASFSLPRSSSASARSSEGVRPRGRVPLIGRVSTSRPRTRRKRSGLAERMRWSPASRYAPNVDGVRERRRSYADSGGQRLDRLRIRGHGEIVGDRRRLEPDPVARRDDERLAPYAVDRDDARVDGKVDVRNLQVGRLVIVERLEHPSEVVRQVSDDAAEERVRGGAGRGPREPIEESLEAVERIADLRLLAPRAREGGASAATAEPADRIRAEERVPGELRVAERGVEEEGPSATPRATEQGDRVRASEGPDSEPQPGRHRDGIGRGLVKF